MKSFVLPTKKITNCNSTTFLRNATIDALTPVRTLSISGLKSLSLEFIIFELRNDVKKWSRIYFEFHQARSEIPAKLPGQFGQSGQIFLHWAAATLKGLGQFQNKF